VWTCPVELSCPSVHSNPAVATSVRGSDYRDELKGPPNVATMSTMAYKQLAASPTTEDYFRLLAKRAEYAADHGNYAIAAALVFRDSDAEAVFEGWNTLFGERQPSGHAEMNAIQLTHAVASLPDEAATGLVHKAMAAGAIHARRRIDNGQRESILYTTLEPCPMCTVCLINAGVDHVIIAAQDPPSGALEHSRLRRLPPLWSDLADASGLKVSFCQSNDPEDVVTYVPADLHDELLDRFMQSRGKLDKVLGDNGVLDFQAASSHAWEIVHGD
jgi:tRNA(Arg) A34 adenosine deaminase TadA